MASPAEAALVVSSELEAAQPGDDLAAAAAAQQQQQLLQQEQGGGGDLLNSGTLIRLFVGDLSETTTMTSLTTYFSQFGPVLHAVVKYPRSGRNPASADAPTNRIFGFISVVGEATAKAILERSHTIDGKLVATPEIAKQRGEARGAPPEAANGRPPRSSMGGGGGGAHGSDGNKSAPVETRKIFVGGLSHSTKEEALTRHFGQFGVLSDVVVMTEGNSRRPRGFGFVTFEDPQSVDRVVRQRFHPVDGRSVEVKAAIPRDVMRLQAAAHVSEYDGSPGVTGNAPGTYDGSAAFAADVAGAMMGMANNAATGGSGIVPTGAEVPRGHLAPPPGASAQPTEGFGLYGEHAAAVGAPGEEWWYAHSQIYTPNSLMVPTGVPVYSGYAPHMMGAMPMMGGVGAMGGMGGVPPHGAMMPPAGVPPAAMGPAGAAAAAAHLAAPNAAPNVAAAAGLVPPSARVAVPPTAMGPMLVPHQLPAHMMMAQAGSLPQGAMGVGGAAAAMPYGPASPPSPTMPAALWPNGVPAAGGWVAPPGAVYPGLAGTPGMAAAAPGIAAHPAAMMGAPTMAVAAAQMAATMAPGGAYPADNMAAFPGDLSAMATALPSAMAGASAAAPAPAAAAAATATTPAAMTTASAPAPSEDATASAIKGAPTKEAGGSGSGKPTPQQAEAAAPTATDGAK